MQIPQVNGKRQQWTVTDIPDQRGRVAVITGANSGVGFETARALAGKRATVVLACRNLAKGQAALTAIQAEHAGANAVLMSLDLADLRSVRAFAAAIQGDFDRLDVLVNNAGVMALPRLETTDGFEMQFGVNHLGHFALTGLLLPALLRTPGARVVTVSSGMHRWARLDLDDLHGQNSYDRWAAYGQSKLANLLFSYELDRRLRRAGLDVSSLAAHPGYAATNLQTASLEMQGSRLGTRLMRLGNALLAQSQEMGALPQLYAATSLEAVGGAYYGPGGFMESRGYPVQVSSNGRSHDREAAARLWDLSVAMTGVDYALLEEVPHATSYA